MTPPVAELEVHRAALTGHCYRMLGSAVDADDAVQETMVRAWKSLDRFDGRAALRTWLYRIATNVCLDAIAARGRRAMPTEGPLGAIDDDLAQHERTHWLEPIADHRVIPADADPAEQAALRQHIRLAFVAALQHLPAKQRAALLLSEVLGWSAAEVAEALELSIPSVNSALQRARATVATLDPARATPAELTAAQRALIDQYVAAFERYDIDALAALLRTDVVQSMPPYTLWLRGRETIAAWMLGRGAGCRGSRLVPVAACGGPAFAQYRPTPAGGHHAWALIVLDLDADLVREMTFFLDVLVDFPRFGLPLDL
ncbi:MAG: sigma-70 family RNA polymerase sigma factor [Deltaproteobacteria bacterium]|nr:sigma-70 family RNA polymerase sigma factor [Deltaproteobacteria bacterium]